MPIDSDVEGTRVTITNKSGETVFEGLTPAYPVLKTKNGFFSPAKYHVVAEKDGYQSDERYLKARLEPWYWGNIIFGGLIGMLIVDPATGSMWTLSKQRIEMSMIADKAPAPSKPTDYRPPEVASAHTTANQAVVQEVETAPAPPKANPLVVASAASSGNSSSGGTSDRLAVNSLVPNSLTAGATPVRFSRNRWAVVVGISDYQYGDAGLAHLAYASKDAEDFSEALSKQGWPSDRVQTLIDSQATERNIRVALESWLTKARPDDLIVLYWSGHGFPDPDDPRRFYFACYDTDPRIPSTGYRMDRVRQALDERGARNVVVVADTCHSGGIATRSSNEKALGKVIIEDLQKGQSAPEPEETTPADVYPRGWVYLLAADSDRKAIETSNWSNGAFTHVLLQGLNGEADGFEAAGRRDGSVTLGELRQFLQSRMPDETHEAIGKALHPNTDTNCGDPRIWDLPMVARPAQ